LSKVGIVTGADGRVLAGRVLRFGENGCIEVVDGGVLGAVDYNIGEAEDV
jgi:hypothetical protein